jgi:hypothetical protein
MSKQLMTSLTDMNKAIYRPVANDGAKWKCADCQQYKQHNEVWHISLANGKKEILCKDCVDAEWLDTYAVFDPKPI